MANTKKLIQAAAGAAGGEALNIEDVFSTYLYDGTGAAQTIQNGINLGSSYGGQSYSFDGSDDFLLRTSDFTSNTDSKTFTFSCWYFSNLDQTGYWYTTSNGASNNGRVIIGRANGNLQIIAYNNSGSSILNVSTSANIPYGTWNHIVVSIDLANTSNRHVYINDSAHTVSYNTYTNDTIGFSNTTHAVSGNSYSSSSSGQTSLAHVFLDYTYRDLSVESNRRLFYSSSGEPATGQASLNPIMYMTLTSESSPNTNSGTGGDFTTQGSPTYNSNFGPDAGGTGEGGLVWIKDRNYARNHMLQDSERGTNFLFSDLTNAQVDYTTNAHTLNSNGFTINGANVQFNQSGSDYASWTFRKAPKFFDVVTYTGTGSAQNISHNLGSVPGCIIIKSTSHSTNWTVYHRGMDATAPEDYNMHLNTTDARADETTRFNDTAPTDTEFTVGTFSEVNEVNYEFVAYLFAHNDGDGDFGSTADQDIIKCGSYAGNGAANTNVIDLGFEPQWVMIKNTSSTSGNWNIFDNMRGITTGGTDPYLAANTSDAEGTTLNIIDLHANGFTPSTDAAYVNASGSNYIYIAIRRGPMAVPESATDVFQVGTVQNNTPKDVSPASDFPVDFVLHHAAANSSTGNKLAINRLANDLLYTNLTGGAYGNYSSYSPFDHMDNVQLTGLGAANGAAWMWKRAPSFCDVVAYTGNGTAGRTVSHNLGVAPEMMWVKRRNTTGEWAVYHSGMDATAPEDYFMYLQATNARIDQANVWNDTAPTDNLITLGSSSFVNYSSGDYIAYLFASLDGVSKVGSYTGNGTTQNIDCGFSSGARFVLIKRTDSTGGWWVFDTERGIVSGNDSLLYLHTTLAENTSLDFIDPYSSGFAVTATSSNVSGGSYIFYAIA